MKKTMLFLSMTFILSFAANAQGWLNKVGAAAKDAAKRTMEKRVEEKAEQVTDKVLDKAEDAVTKSTKSNKKQTDKTTGDIDEQIIEKQEHPKQKLTSITQYDFVPGDKILFFEDFSQDAIGDFPALWTTNGSGEVKTVSIAPGKWLLSVKKTTAFHSQCLKKL
jgi:thioesterase domain-containing protein